MTERRIIHIDMDYFFAQVEMRDNPKLKGKPVIVGGKASHRGVVSTASYEARAYGVHSAMPMTQAHKLCPNGYYVTSRFDTYREVSGQIMKIFRSYTELVEPMSLDEAYLDIETGFTSINHCKLYSQRYIRSNTFNCVSWRVL